MRKKLVSCITPEGTAHLKNPGRGFYHMYSFYVEQDPDTEQLSENLWADDALVHLFFNIGAYRNVPLDDKALKNIDTVMTFFEEKGYDLIIRFAYDSEGKGTESEPHSMSWIARHMADVGPIVKAHAPHILVLQGLFLGSWGEMHGTHYDTPANLKELADTLKYETGGSVTLAVRKPCQWRCAFRNKGDAGIYNDGIFGSDTDLGTYAEGVTLSIKPEPTKPWTRERELAWQNDMLDGVPNGGEVLKAINTPGVGLMEALPVLTKMHLTYLNGAYQPEQLSVWKSEKPLAGIWRDADGLKYIGEHLGYRIVVRDVKLTRYDGITLTLENVGFASPVFEIEMALIFKTNDGEYACGLKNVPKLSPGTIKVEILEDEARKLRMDKPGYLYLSIVRKKDLSPIYVANEGAGQRVLIGEIKK